MSVLIPTFNRAQALPRALQSVFCQDFTDFEVVVVDDGSTDETSLVLDRLADRRLRRFGFEKNRGIGAARREGVARAQGRLIAFLDSDDCWKPGKLARVVAFLDANPTVELVFSDFENVDELRSTAERGFAEARPLLDRLAVRALPENWWLVEAGAAEALLHGNFVGTTSVVAAPRTLFDRIGNFRDDLSGPEDFECWWRAAVRGARFAYCGDVLVERHRDRSSITRSKRPFARQRLRALDACDSAASEAGRLDLLAGLRQARARTYGDLIEACALEGRRAEAWRAFWAARRLGWRAGSLKYLGLALLGPRLASMSRRALGRRAR